MIYLRRNAVYTVAETIDTAQRKVSEGWQLCSRAEYMAAWRARDRLDALRLFGRIVQPLAAVELGDWMYYSRGG